MPYKAPKARPLNAPEKQVKRVDERPSAARRGDGRRWRKLRAMVLQREPLCRDCAEHALVVEATDVHHIIAKRDGGKDEASNMMALCHACHSKRTARGE
jgi:5-methylcytosine-specific restriction protein A